MDKWTPMDLATCAGAVPVSMVVLSHKRDSANELVVVYESSSKPGATGSHFIPVVVKIQNCQVI